MHITHEDPQIVTRVVARHEAADGVVSIELEASDGGELPAWEPGAHIDLDLAEDLVRQYSLCGDPADRRTWRIGVLREPAGRGGSAHIHDHLQVGAEVQTHGPRNHFELRPSPHYLFLAGGIGITPIMAMLGEANRAGASWKLHYGGRSRSSMAFLDELDAHDGRVQVHPQDETGLLDLGSILGEPRADTLVYCCGPEPLLLAVEAATSHWPVDSLHVERFAPKVIDAPVSTDSFEVELTLSGLTLTVEPDRSILEVVTEAGVQTWSSCQEGTCGTCETPVLAGEPDHRDSVLSPSEQAANDTMMICVGRSKSPRLVLEL